MLREIFDPPQQLFVRGELPTGPAVAIVGTRRPTNYGKTIAYQLARELSQSGLVIISGLAYGIDGVVHEAVVEAGGQTVAVLGCGLDVCYPSRHKGLADQIVLGGGAVITEHTDGTPPLPHHFPLRNRIIAGLSEAVIVPEADARSGSLITAHAALQENRLVMAVPGPITSERSAGPNNLIKAGAIPVTSAADIFVALGLVPADVKKPAVGKTALETSILEALEERAYSTEDLATALECRIPELLSSLTLLEMAGRIRNLGASTWVRL